MRKLKTMKEFQKEGLELKKSEMSNINGGAETYYYKDTTVPRSDCQRCTAEDNPRLQHGDSGSFHCVYVQ